MPITDNGFQRLTYDDILEIQIERAKLLFGDNIDTSDQSVFGKILRLYSLYAADEQETAEISYLSRFPNTARGVSLDRLCPFAGITRNPATYAKHVITISGTADTSVEMGFMVSAGNVVFHTVDEYKIGSDGKVTAIVECNDSGTIGNVPVGSIDTIVNPSAEITSISHQSVYYLATDAESDYELRIRFSKAVLGQGSGTAESIIAAVMRVSGVEYAGIEENNTSSASGDLPAHSFRVYVLAPESSYQSIAEAIFSKKAIGVQTSGDESVVVLDENGDSHLIYFSCVNHVDIYVKCTIKTNDDYKSSSTQEIKDRIIQKINAYKTGQDVTATSLYGYVYVDGVEDVTSLTISSNGENYGTETIKVLNSEVARTSSAYIEVTVS